MDGEIDRWMVGWMDGETEGETVREVKEGSAECLMAL